MAWTVVTGPPGREAYHEWNGFTFNNWAASSGARITQITGMKNLAEVDDQRSPAQGRRGEVLYPSYPRGKLVTIEGFCFGMSLPEMRLRENEFRNIFNERSDEGRMVLGLPSWFDPEVQFTYTARVASFEMDDDSQPLTRVPSPFLLKFLLGLRMSDPRIYAWPTPVTDGNGSGNICTPTNQGRADTDPTFVVENVPADGTVTLENLSVPTSNGHARLRFTHLPAGDLLVAFHDRIVTVDGEDARNHLDHVYSQWWDELIPGVIPGMNTLKVTGGSNYVVTFYHAYE